MQTDRSIRTGEDLHFFRFFVSFVSFIHSASLISCNDLNIINLKIMVAHWSIYVQDDIGWLKWTENHFDCVQSHIMSGERAMGIGYAFIEHFDDSDMIPNARSMTTMDDRRWWIVDELDTKPLWLFMFVLNNSNWHQIRI